MELRLDEILWNDFKGEGRWRAYVSAGKMELTQHDWVQYSIIFRGQLLSMNHVRRICAGLGDDKLFRGEYRHFIFQCELSLGMTERRPL